MTEEANEEWEAKLFGNEERTRGAWERYQATCDKLRVAQDHLHALQEQTAIEQAVAESV